MAHSSQLASLASSHTNNQVRPSDELFHSIYEFGFNTWAQLYIAASTNPRLPLSYLSPQEAFPQHPSFPATVLVQYNEFEAFVAASSIWGLEMSACSYGLPSFERPISIGITTKTPIPLSVSDVPQDDLNYSSWFVSDDNYLLVLILACTYILSARWAELIPTTCSVEYTTTITAHSDAVNDKRIDHEDLNTVCIDIDYADQDEVRWWSAILSPGQG
ncbi:hypothetical protein PtrV1_05984 [Pyrenophora tritici-repentis]|uniref:Uncharacterized protein n=1 Tax=Pyrenophora tritici-repentis TaxID=45151 RepID=A0A317ARX3_9PLEO|nr:hypothetical protein PtrV1_05984 [Pyrenophora tritici-repentis]KAF7450723.1 hypothetical protein A1F99_053390 [Pyrenophora tritici-repentis]KAF7573364.1 hypothetical protein PtrM4_082690 [Pyrenophora tritici-repentis]KAI1516317.1 hypothetical protein Ptr86124_004854 [Pyrenophora tritici-repentis]KAI1559209.1 hypothetical protein PtrEW7m1_011967 [Pyrenophora tritici-repentis]